jgi:hypothetical protein
MATSGRDIQVIGGEQPSRPNGKFGRYTGRLEQMQLHLSDLRFHSR